MNTIRKDHPGLLRKYCRQRKITMAILAEITGASEVTLYEIDNDPKANVRVETINKIYLGTKKIYGEALMPQDYLNQDFLKQKYDEQNQEEKGRFEKEQRSSCPKYQ